jgi:hypothetical protein
MPAPHNEWQALELERAELPNQLAAYQRELEGTAPTRKERCAWLEWQIRRAQKRIGEIDARLAGS